MISFAEKYFLYDGSPKMIAYLFFSICEHKVWDSAFAQVIKLEYMFGIRNEPVKVRSLQNAQAFKNA